MTNLDKIRSMDVQALAEFLRSIQGGQSPLDNIHYCSSGDCPYYDECNKIDEGCIEPDLTADIQWWLVQSVSE